MKTHDNRCGVFCLAHTHTHTQSGSSSLTCSWQWQAVRGGGIAIGHSRKADIQCYYFKLLSLQMSRSSFSCEKSQQQWLGCHDRKRYIHRTGLRVDLRQRSVMGSTSFWFKSVFSSHKLKYILTVHYQSYHSAESQHASRYVLDKWKFANRKKQLSVFLPILCLWVQSGWFKRPEQLTPHRCYFRLLFGLEINWPQFFGT